MATAVKKLERDLIMALSIALASMSGVVPISAKLREKRRMFQVQVIVMTPVMVKMRTVNQLMIVMSSKVGYLQLNIK